MIVLFNEKYNCCGCTACMNICPKNAISMKSDNEGFLYPNIDYNKCIECKLCKKICKFQAENSESNKTSIPIVYGVKHKDNNVRMNSTSGGMFTAISDFILDKDGIVFGAAFDNNMEVCHLEACTKEEAKRFRGSKYVQSDLKTTFKRVKELLNEDKYVLFTGTPCQVDGLKSYLRNMNIDKLILCDIVCHGAPSPLIFREYIKFCGNKNNSNIVSYNFRDKINGWHSHTEKAIYDNGKEDFKSSMSRIQQKLFYSHTILRPACHKCIYTSIKRKSDITIADFWGIEKSNPDFDDNKGVSLVLLNTKKGISLFNEIKSKLDYIESNAKDCLQPQLQYPSKQSPVRDEFWKQYYEHGFEYVAKKYGGYSIKIRFKAKLLNILKNIGIIKKRS